MINSNPMLANLTKNILSQKPQISDFISLMKNANNPSLVLEEISKKNPQMKQILEMVKSNKDPKPLFYRLAKEKGVDP